jgi:hypothetical protein
MTSKTILWPELVRLINLVDTSLTNLLNKDPLNVLFANLAVIAEDCTQHFLPLPQSMV